MSGEGSAPERLSEAEAREIVTARLDWVYRHRVKEVYALLSPIAAAWALYVIYTLLQKNGQTNPAYLTYCLIFTGLIILLYTVVTLYNNQYRHNIKKALDRTPNTQQKLLVPGPDTEFQKIVDHVPGMFRKWFPSGKFKLMLSEQTVLVAKNLDWYLAEPKSLVRFSWVSVIYVLLVTCALYSYLVLIAPRGNALPLQWATFVCLVLYFLVQEGLIKTISRRLEGIRVEVYREFVADWFRRHPLDEQDA